MKQLISTTRRPDITFCRDGRIHITAAVAAALQLQPGDSINVYADDGEFYVFAVPNAGHGRFHARIYPTKQGCRNFRANSARLARRLLDACGISAHYAAFATGNPICLFGRTYIPIITKHPLSND